MRELTRLDLPKTSWDYVCLDEHGVVSAKLTDPHRFLFIADRSVPTQTADFRLLADGCGQTNGLQMRGWLLNR
jgi:hypothetical protein